VVRACIEGRGGGGGTRAGGGTGTERPPFPLGGGGGGTRAEGRADGPAVGRFGGGGGPADTRVGGGGGVNLTWIGAGRFGAPFTEGSLSEASFWIALLSLARGGGGGLDEDRATTDS